ncbi:hypothetical protein CMI48_00030 [Candidatus Pacearchaeota archaeon]|jgi:hypothetical protein|nr:hypothetical protein [Candidatus Pacearchaeota archaeon]
MSDFSGLNLGDILSEESFSSYNLYPLRYVGPYTEYFDGSDAKHVSPNYLMERLSGDMLRLCAVIHRAPLEVKNDA